MIQLRWNTTGNVIYVNPALVVAVDARDGVTRVWFGNGRMFEVAEAEAVVIARMDAYRECLK